MMIACDGTENKGRLGANAILGRPSPCKGRSFNGQTPALPLYWGIAQLYPPLPHDEHHQWWGACRQHP